MRWGLIMSLYGTTKTYESKTLQHHQDGDRSVLPYQHEGSWAKSSQYHCKEYLTGVFHQILVQTVHYCMQLHLHVTWMGINQYAMKLIITMARVSKLRTDNLSIIVVPGIITDCTPLVLITNLNSSLTAIGPTNKSNSTISARCCSIDRI